MAVAGTVGQDVFAFPMLHFSSSVCLLVGWLVSMFFLPQLLFFFLLPWLLILCKKTKKEKPKKAVQQPEKPKEIAKPKEEVKKSKEMDKPKEMDKSKEMDKPKEEVKMSKEEEEKKKREMDEEKEQAEVNHIFNSQWKEMKDWTLDEQAVRLEKLVGLFPKFKDFNADRIYGSWEEFLSSVVGTEIRATRPLYLEHKCRNPQKYKTSEETCPLCSAYIKWAAFYYTEASEYDIANLEEDFYKYGGKVPKEIEENERYVEFKKKKTENAKTPEIEKTQDDKTQKEQKNEAETPEDENKKK